MTEVVSSSFVPTLAWAGFTSAAPLVALLLPMFVTNISGVVKNSMLAATAGMLLAIATLDLIPEAINMGATEEVVETVAKVASETLHTHGEHGSLHVPLIGVGLGFLALLLMERLMNNHGHIHLDDDESHEHSPNESSGGQFSLVALMAVILHSFLDGLVIAGAFKASDSMGTRVGIAILLHKLPDGFVAVSVTTGQRDWRKKAFYAVGAVSVATFIGAMFGAVVLQSVETSFLGFLLSFAAGSFLFIMASTVLRELPHGKDTALVILSCIGGYMIILATHYFVHG